MVEIGIAAGSAGAWGTPEDEARGTGSWLGVPPRGKGLPLLPLVLPLLLIAWGSAGAPQARRSGGAERGWQGKGPVQRRGLPWVEWEWGC